MPGPAASCLSADSVAWYGVPRWTPRSPSPRNMWAIAPQTNITTAPINPAMNTRMACLLPEWCAEASPRAVAPQAARAASRCSTVQRAASQGAGPHQQQAACEARGEIGDHHARTVGAREHQAFEHQRRERGHAAEHADDEEGAPQHCRGAARLEPREGQAGEERAGEVHRERGERPAAGELAQQPRTDEV